MDENELIKAVYPDINSHFQDTDFMFKCAILAPRNDEVDRINDLAELVAERGLAVDPANVATVHPDKNFELEVGRLVEALLAHLLLAHVAHLVPDQDLLQLHLFRKKFS